MEYFAEQCVQLDLEQQYLKQKCVGKGHFGKVFFAKELETDEGVAIKSISKAKIKKIGESLEGINT